MEPASIIIGLLVVAVMTGIGIFILDLLLLTSEGMTPSQQSAYDRWVSLIRLHEGNLDLPTYTLKEKMKVTKTKGKVVQLMRVRTTKNPDKDFKDAINLMVDRIKGSDPGAYKAATALLLDGGVSKSDIPPEVLKA